MHTNSDSYKEPRCVADALELGFLNDHDDSQDPELYRLLYRHARNEDGKRELIQNNPSFKRGWIDLGSGPARELVSVFVAQDDDENLKHARNIAKNNLEAVPWNNILGIDDPPIQLKIKIHGNRWAMRFQSSLPSLRGSEKINEELPALSNVQKQADGNLATDALTPSKENHQPEEKKNENTAESILQLGGLPA